MATDNPCFCFAPRITEEVLDTCRGIVSDLPEGAAKEWAAKLLAAVEAWWDLPESTKKETRNWRFRVISTGEELVKTERPLDDEIAKELWSRLPWDEELVLLRSVHDAMPTGREHADGTGAVVDRKAYDARNCFGHLLWVVAELSAGREPIFK